MSHGAFSAVDAKQRTDYARVLKARIAASTGALDDVFEAIGKAAEAGETWCTVRNLAPEEYRALESYGYQASWAGNEGEFVVSWNVKT